MFREAPDLPGFGGAQLQVQAADPGRPAVTRRRGRRPGPATLAVEAQVRVLPTLRGPPLPVCAAVWPVRHVLAEAFQAGAAAGVDELVVVHGSIITETATHGPSYPSPDENTSGETEKETQMRRSAIALVIIVAGLVAAACTNPSGGGGAASGAPAPAASSAPVAPGY